MQVNKVAILIDGGFYIQRFKALHGGTLPTKVDVENSIKDILKRIDAKNPPNTCNVLYRTFYYDCLPFEKNIKSHDKTREINYSEKPLFKSASKFINSLKLIDQFALRLGELSFTGWKIHAIKKQPVPDFKQKGVDMKIGLDMAWMAGKKSVSKMVLVTGDSDFISPIKHVRREGLMVYLYPMGQKQIKRELKQHCDFLLDVFS